MIASLGSLRRSKSTSSSITAASRTTPGHQQARGPSRNLSAVGRRHAQAAAIIAFESSEAMVRPPAHAEQPPRPRARRSTIASLYQARHSSVGGSGSEMLSYCADSGGRLPIAVDAPSSGRSFQSPKQSMTEDTVEPPLRRTYSMRRTMRSSESARLTSRSSTSGLRAVSSARAEHSDAQYAANSAQLRKARSFYTWMPWCNSPPSSTAQVLAYSGNPATHGNISFKSHPSATSTVQACVELLQQPASDKEASGSFPNSLRHRASSIFSYRRRRELRSSPLNVGGGVSGVESYPTSGTPVCSLADRDLRNQRNTSNTSSKRSEPAGKNLLRFFSRSSRTPMPTICTATEAGIWQEPVTSSPRAIHATPTARQAISLAQPELCAVASDSLADPFGIIATKVDQQILSQPEGELGHGASPEFESESVTTRSRVTSWADSTITGETDERLSVIAEVDQHAEFSRSPHGETDEASSSNKPDAAFRSTLLRRFVRGPRSRAARSTRDQAIDEQPLGLRAGASAKSAADPLTIRTVADDDAGDVKPSGQTTFSATLPADCDYHAQPALRRKPVPSRAHCFNTPDSSTTPTAATRAQRAAKADNRWASPILESQGLFYPRSPVSCERKPRTPKTGNDMHEASTGIKSSPSSLMRLDVSTAVAETAALSPSVYSQASGFHSSPLSLWHDAHGTATIIGCRSFAAQSPTRTVSRGNTEIASRDWSKWLDQETADLVADVSAISFEGLTESIITSTPARHIRENATIVADDSDDNSIIADGALGCNALNSFEVVGPSVETTNPTHVAPTDMASHLNACSSTAVSSISPSSKILRVRERDRRLSRLEHIMTPRSEPDFQPSIDYAKHSPKNSDSTNVSFDDTMPIMRSAMPELAPGDDVKDAATSIIDKPGLQSPLGLDNTTASASGLTAMDTQTIVKTPYPTAHSPRAMSSVHREESSTTNQARDSNMHTYVSKLPLPTTPLRKDHRLYHAASYRSVKDKENMAQVPTALSAKASSRSESPAMNRYITNASPIRVSPLHAQSRSGGQIMARKWLQEKAVAKSPSLDSDLDVSHGTQVFL